MGYTKFGEYMRILRIKFHEVMGDTAKLLDVSLPFLSAVENGKRNVPSEWAEKIIRHYNLSKKESKELMEAIEESRTQIKLDLKKASEAKRSIAVQFARSFDDIDEETALKIKILLNKKKGGRK